MSVARVLPVVREALANTITAGGLRAHKYDSTNISGNSVTLGLSRWNVDHSDHAMGIHSVTIPVFVYQQMDGSQSGIEKLEKRMALVIDALGADRTLGGVCPSISVDTDFDASIVRDPGGALYGIATLEVTVTPYANVGA